jgi:hypothetical protein
MTPLTYEHIHQTLAAQPLFEAKSWQLSPTAWPLSSEQVAQLEAIGSACFEFHQALETLYLRSAAGKNLLRNKPLLAPWVAEYLDRGKPPQLTEHARSPKNRGAFPTVLRPDLLLTDDGFALTELDSVPGGIGLTGFLNRLYGSESDPAMLGHGDAMVKNFHASLAALRPELANPLIALAVSDEAATYRPEMQWLALQLQLLGKRVFCVRPDDIFPLGPSVCIDVDGNPEKIDVIYRFFELFDLANVKTAHFIFDAWAAGEVSIGPPMRHFQEEKLSLALFHHHLLQEFWAETLSGRALKLLRGLIPLSWIIDPAPLPPGAVLDGPRIAGRSLNDWRELASASQKERDLIIKISGYHETAWGARSVVLGSDCSREEWQQGVERALQLAPTNLHILQIYKKPKRIEHPVFQTVTAENGRHEAMEQAGRLRLCPYYFVIDGKTRLSGALATFCPPDKKIIHGMQDAALLPARLVNPEPALAE